MHIQSAFRATLPSVSSRTHDGVSDLISAMQPAAVTFYNSDAVIYAQGDAAGPLYFVEFGTVRICRLTADGRRLISAFHTAGDVFGFEGGDEHESYAESVDGVGIRVLRTNRANQPTSSMLLLAIKSLARTQNHLMVLGRRNANERMAALLLELSERQGNDRLIYLPMQRNDIADYLCLTFETVSRVIRALKDQKVIRLRATNEIEILDFEALEDMCE
jgi:CRP/FNR family nitrogen fixation transcriptional regulator